MSKKPSLPPGAELKRFVEPFRVDGSGRFHLKSHRTDEKGGLNKERAEKNSRSQHEPLARFPGEPLAQDRWAVLVILQGMDAAGKDGVVKHVIEGVNPQGCDVHAFKAPTPRNSTTISSGAARLQAAGARAHRHLQPLLLRGGAGDAGASGAARAERLPAKLVGTDIWRDASRTSPRSSARSRTTAR